MKGTLVSCLIVLATLSLFNTAQSQQTSESNIEYLIEAERTSEALVFEIHGSGDLDLSELQIDPNGGDGGNESTSGYDDLISLQAAIITLDNGFKTKENDALVGLVGATGKDGEYYTCCSESAAEAECCNHEELGELIVPDDADVRSVNVTYSTNSTSSFGKGGVVRFWGTSRAAVVFGNCQSSSTLPSHDEGLSLFVHGKVTWTSNAVSSMLGFYTALTLVYVVLCLWYARLMKTNKETRIQVEKWIMFTISLAASAAVLETVKLATEIYSSNEIKFLQIISLLLSLARHSVTRCLYLVLSLGLGVVTRALSKVTTFLVVLFLTIDLFILWLMHMSFYMNIHITIPYEYGLVRITEYIFTFWIPLALGRTIYYLRLYEENLKLVRYYWFLIIYLLTASLSYMERFVYGGKMFSRSAFREANDIIYLTPLVCVAILWRPNPDQRSYSYALLEDTEEEQFNDDLELTVTVDDNDKKSIEKDNELV